jgi:hypothetical protein
MQEIELKVTLEEANGILQVIGNLPTSSNAWPLLQKLNAQIQAQVPQPATEEKK